MLNVDFASEEDYFYIDTNNSFNLLTLKRNKDSSLEDVKRKLENFGASHYGEPVGTIHPGELE
jgi:hypothetical protein